MPSEAATGAVRYAALGDSYTHGTGAEAKESWPAVVSERLRAKGVAIELMANLAQNGWTSQNLIDYALPLLQDLRPDFVTVLIGTNDWVLEVDPKTFQRNLKRILEHLTQLLPKRRSILILTIPDFSISPAGGQYSNGKDITKGLAQFNQIILSEARAFGLPTVDLFSLSPAFRKNPALFSSDNLHPSAQGYAVWADTIEPEIALLLNTRP